MERVYYAGWSAMPTVYRSRFGRLVSILDVLDWIEEDYFAEM